MLSIYVRSYHLWIGHGRLIQVEARFIFHVDLPPGLVFQDGIISGSAATRTGMMDYVVTMEEIYPETRTRNQTIQIEIYCVEWILPWFIALVCPAEDGWPEIYDRSSVYRSCSLNFGRAIRTCTDGISIGCLWFQVIGKSILIAIMCGFSFFL